MSVRRRWMTRALAVVAALGVLAPASGGVRTPASAAGLDLTCQQVLIKSDPDLLNVAFPDEAAVYFGVGYAAVPGTRLRITGQYPFARYFSYNAYDPMLRPVQAVADVEIQPDAGSSNPFRPGARRDVSARSYTSFVEFTAAPPDPRPNTMYLGGQKAPVGLLLYRIYIPDEGLDERGGVPLPTVTLERTGPKATSAPVPSSVCTEVNRRSLSLLNGLEAAAPSTPLIDSLQPWGVPGNPPFRKFVNLPTSVADFVTSPRLLTPLRALAAPLEAAGGAGGFLSNQHTAYVSTAINRKYGPVVVVRFRVPTTPRTRERNPVMAESAQLRYWSICTNEFFTQRFIDCADDEQVPVAADGTATIVISNPDQRPANARTECGVQWLAWGPNAEGVLIYRHMLPDPGFAAAIQRATYRSEERTMGDYLPKASYLPSPAAFTATC